MNNRFKLGLCHDTFILGFANLRFVDVLENAIISN